ncbi:hypothetical protein N8927_03820 [Crocinitomicaceae bacterium]|nr:hypothetical protein [Crocinitomicaceae bacterium]
MAHLTKYNFGKLCRSVNLKNTIDRDTFLKHCYDDPDIYYMLNKLEVEYLFKYRNILKDEKSFYEEYYSVIPEKEDTKEFVFDKGGKTKYHHTSACELIKKDYLDFNIPVEIRELGDDAIHEYRDWFQHQGYAEQYKLGKLDKNKIIRNFNGKYPSKYGFKPIAENSNILIVEVPNSNNKEIKTKFNLDEFKEKIDVLKAKWEYEFQSKTAVKFSKFKHLLTATDDEINDKMTEVLASDRYRSEDFIANYGINNLKKKFAIAKKLNNEIISELLTYFKWTYNIDSKDFDTLTLEKFGLKCCYKCKSKKGHV